MPLAQAQTAPSSLSMRRARLEQMQRMLSTSANARPGFVRLGEMEDIEPRRRDWPADFVGSRQPVRVRTRKGLLNALVDRCPRWQRKPEDPYTTLAPQELLMKSKPAALDIVG